MHDRLVGRKVIVTKNRGKRMLSKFSVKKPYTVVVSVIIVLILGIISFMHLRTDLLPSIDLPYVVIMTNYSGASLIIENAVTKPIEQAVATTNK